MWKLVTTDSLQEILEILETVPAKFELQNQE